MRSIAAIASLCATIALSGCYGEHNEVEPPPNTASVDLPIGRGCTVQFRRDLLGGSAQNPIPPTTDFINGANVSVHGTLLKVDAEWVVIRSDNTTLWIPRSNVLLLSTFSQD